jgi:hypothetical protein
MQLNLPKLGTPDIQPSGKYPFMSGNSDGSIRDNNKILVEDRAIHDWYRFVLSFPPHLVRNYIERFGLNSRSHVLDPFCGTGTTLIECKKQGISCDGVEANPMAYFATKVKLDWSVDPDGLIRHTQKIADLTISQLKKQGVEDTQELPLFHPQKSSAIKLRTLPENIQKLLLRNSISPLPLHKTLVLLGTLDDHKNESFSSHEKLALARAIVSGISNLHFGPEVGVGLAKPDAPVVTIWLNNIKSIVRDLRGVKNDCSTNAVVFQGDSRNPIKFLKPNSVDAVITSPPYPNEKDYTRTTRLESVLLGFIRSKEDLQLLKRELVRSNTRGVYKGDSDDLLVANHDEIQRIADAIEKRRIELRKTSGFERLYAKVTKLYFGGMVRHLSELRTILRPGAQLAYVVGDQASYLRVMIRTGQLLADIAQSLGYEVVGIDLFRTRLATATKEQLREEVVLLQWKARKY